MLFLLYLSKGLGADDEYLKLLKSTVKFWLMTCSWRIEPPIIIIIQQRWGRNKAGAAKWKKTLHSLTLHHTKHLIFWTGHSSHTVSCHALVILSYSVLCIFLLDINVYMFGMCKWVVFPIPSRKSLPYISPQTPFLWHILTKTGIYFNAVPPSPAHK